MLRYLLNNIEEWFHKDDARLEFESLDTLHVLLIQNVEIFKLNVDIIRDLVINILLSPLRFGVTIDRIVEFGNLFKKINRYPPLPLINAMDEESRSNLVNEINNVSLLTEHPPTEGSMKKREEILHKNPKHNFYNKFNNYLDPVKNHYFNQETLVDKAYNYFLIMENEKKLNVEGNTDLDDSIKKNLEDSDSDESEDFKKRNQTGYSYPKNIMKKEVNSPTEDDGLPSSQPDIDFSQTSQSPQPNRRKVRDRIYWTTEEVDALTEGVKKYGAGNWAVILRAYKNKFHDKRKPPDLKDKWRNVLAQKNKVKKNKKQ